MTVELVSVGPIEVSGFDPTISGLDVTVAAGVVDVSNVTGATFTVPVPSTEDHWYGVYVDASDTLILVDDTDLQAQVPPDFPPSHKAKPVWFRIQPGDTDIDTAHVFHYLCSNT